MSKFNAKPKLAANDSTLISSFGSLQTFGDVCDMLEVTPLHLRYILYEKSPAHYYRNFTISKKNYEVRQITAPTGSLKILQQKLNTIMKLVYKPNAIVHGYVVDKSIVTNAKVHLRKKNLLNFDLKDFFPSINFGRVRGVLMSFFGMGNDAATVIANICCYENSLPQGAPTSPILSNMVCFNLDKQMQLIARQHSCSYTRYADDLTFSTTKKEFPRLIAYQGDGVIHLGQKILKIIDDNKFKINQTKTRLNNRLQHLSVTGITVNEKLNVKRDYIKKLRAILRCLEKNSLEQAQAIFETKYTKIRNKRNSAFPSILSVVKGMITFISAIKGNQDSIYEKLASRYNRIVGEAVLKVGEDFTNYWNEKVWVVELGYKNDDGQFIPTVQGTGFFLKDIGFVTNAHVVREFDKEILDTIYINRSRYGKELKAATILKMDKDKDIAILSIEDHNISIGFNYSNLHYAGLEVKVIGYPNHGGKDSLYVVRGEITQYRKHYLESTYNKETGELGTYQDRIVISARIIEGNSGGPIINMKGEVIGVATKGFKENSPSKKDDSTADNIVVKIEDVLALNSRVIMKPIP